MNKTMFAQRGTKRKRDEMKPKEIKETILKAKRNEIGFNEIKRNKTK